MINSRIRLVDDSAFDEREWLRREVLWASLMSPYSIQLDGFIDGTELRHHQGNASRAELYAKYTDDSEAQALAFFNQGKKIGGILSAATVFRTVFNENPRHDGEELSFHVLRMQARSIDIALGELAIPSIFPDSELGAFSESGRQTGLALRAPQQSYARRHHFLRAAKIMTGLATQEVAAWRSVAAQGVDSSLPVLTIHDGGHPRSAGPRVEMLQPKFNEILASEAYQSAGTDVAATLFPESVLGR